MKNSFRALVAVLIVVGVVNEAQAIIGMPFTPFSYAGVARRTAYRTVAVASTAAVATTAVVATSAAVAASAPPPQQAAPPPPASGGPAIGAIVTTLPSGCTTSAISGVEYYVCGNTFYRTAFQGNNLVYVVSQP